MAKARRIAEAGRFPPVSDPTERRVGYEDMEINLAEWADAAAEASFQKYAHLIDGKRSKKQRKRKVTENA